MSFTSCNDPFNPDWCRNTLSALHSQQDVNAFFQARLTEIGLCLQQLNSEQGNLSAIFTNGKTSFQQTLDSLTNSVSSLQTGLSTLQASQLDVENKFSSLQGNVSGFEESTSKTVNALSDTVAKFQTQLSALQTDFNDFRSKIDPDVLSQLQQTYEDIQKTLDEKVKLAIDNNNSSYVDIQDNQIRASVSSLTQTTNQRLASVESLTTDQGVALSDGLNTLTKKINCEGLRASEQENILAEALNNEVCYRKCGDKALDKKICEEANARKDADAQITSDYKAADAKIIEDYQAADAQITSDYKAADAKIIEDYQAADAQITSDYKAADAKIIEDYQAANAQITSDYKAADDALLDSIKKEEEERKNDVSDIKETTDGLSQRVSLLETNYNSLLIGLAKLEERCNGFETRIATLENKVK